MVDQSIYIFFKMGERKHQKGGTNIPTMLADPSIIHNRW